MLVGKGGRWLPHPSMQATALACSAMLYLHVTG